MAVEDGEGLSHRGGDPRTRPVPVHPVDVTHEILPVGHFANGLAAVASVGVSDSSGGVVEVSGSVVRVGGRD